MNKRDVVEQVKETVEEVPRKTGPAGLLIVFYIAATIGGLVLLGVLYIWLVRAN